MTNATVRLRQDLEKVDGVSATWFEWTLENSEMIRTLVVEVEFDTDPDAEGFKSDALHAVESLALNTLMDASMTTTHLKVVPKRTDVRDTPRSE